MQNKTSTHLEVEAKIAVPSLEPIRERLKRLGAEPGPLTRQEDLYLEDPENRLLKKDCGLRLRRQTDATRQTLTLTWKGPRLPGPYKSRQETEFQVSDYDAAVALFQQLGLTPAVRVEKSRQVWTVGPCLICLDELPHLGAFVEVEGPDENRVRDILRRLDLADRPHISQGYARLTQKAKKSKTE